MKLQHEPDLATILLLCRRQRRHLPAKLAEHKVGRGPAAAEAGLHRRPAELAARHRGYCCNSGYTATRVASQRSLVPTDQGKR